MPTTKDPTTRKTRPFRELLTERLANPQVAAAYLNATMEHSPENFLNALRDVAHARQMVTTVKDASGTDDALSQSLSGSGDPTMETVSSILKAVGLRLSISEQSAQSAVEGETSAETVHA